MSPLRSQTLWHAIAEGVSEGQPPTLSFMRPTSPYVSIGFHRRLEEIDGAYCQAEGIPVYRRRAGGGPVYLDADQYFFQVTVPVDHVAAHRTRALADLLRPAVAAYQAAGIAEAHLDDLGEIAVGDAKICGHAAGQIGTAVVVVGNLITAFDHQRATRILSAPNPEARALMQREMERHVAPHPADPNRFREAAIAAYAESLGLQPTVGELTPSEHEHLERYDEEFLDDDWMTGPVRPPEPSWKVKIRAGVEVVGGGSDGTRAALVLRQGVISAARLVDPGLNGRAESLGERLRGLTLEDAHNQLTNDGPAGRRIAAALTPGREHP